MNPQRQGRQQEKASQKPKWKNYDFTMFWSRITISHGIAVKWYLRVYWLLPLSIIDSFKKNRRFFWKAPTTLLLSTMNTWASQSTSFPKGVISCFLQTLFLFINWNCRQLGRSHTESTDTSHKALLSFCLTKRSCQRYRTPVFLADRARICTCSIEGRASMRRSLSLDWYPARKERKR